MIRVQFIQCILESIKVLIMRFVFPFINLQEAVSAQFLNFPKVNIGRNSHRWTPCHQICIETFLKDFLNFITNFLGFSLLPHLSSQPSTFDRLVNSFNNFFNRNFIYSFSFSSVMCFCISWKAILKKIYNPIRRGRCFTAPFRGVNETLVRSQTALEYVSVLQKGRMWIRGRVIRASSLGSKGP